MSLKSNTTKPMVDLNKSAVARYLQLATFFRRRIDSGEWVVGAQIPTVDALAKECGVASMTIRQALDILEKEGLIDRYRAKGTFVRQRPVRDLWCKVHTDWTGMLMARDDATIELLHDETGVPLTSYVGDAGTPAAGYRHLRRRHSREGKAFLLADVYIAEEVARLIPEAAYTTKTAMRLVADVPGIKIVDARQLLTIESADLDTATLLDIPLSDPTAKVQRVAIDESGRLVLVADGIYRGDMVRFEMNLR